MDLDFNLKFPSPKPVLLQSSLSFNNEHGRMYK